MTKIHDEPRMARASEICEDFQHGVALIPKPPRVGVTTSITIALYLRDETTLVLEPSREIAERTVQQDIPEVCKQYGIKPPTVAYVRSNHFCVFNTMELEAVERAALEKESEYRIAQNRHEAGEITKEELKKSYLVMETAHDIRKNYKRIDIFPKRSPCGSDCIHYETCPCMELQHKTQYDEMHDKYTLPNIIVMTYGKLGNVERAADGAEAGLNSEMLEIFQQVNNIVIDEADTLENISSEDILIKEINNDPNTTKIESLYAKYGRYKKLAKLKDYNDKGELTYKYPMIAKALKYTWEIIENPLVRNTLKKCESEALSEDYNKKHIKRIINNPIQLEQKDIIRKKDPVKFVGLVSECYRAFLEGDASNCGLSVLDLNVLMKFASIVNTKQLIAHSMRGDYQIITCLSDAKSPIMLALTRFFKEFQEKEKYRIIITTGTFNSFNYRTLFKKGTEITRIPFGDPLKTNDKLKIFNYDLSLSSNAAWSNSIRSKLPHLLSILESAVDEFGAENIFVCTINIKAARLLEAALTKAGYNVPVTWYRAVNTRGVPNSARFGIFIGAGYVRANSLNKLGKSLEDRNKKARERVWNDTWQALMRIKDGDGIEPSAALVIMSRKDLDDMINHVSLYDPETKRSAIKRPEVVEWAGDESRFTFKQIKDHLGLSKNDKNSKSQSYDTFSQENKSGNQQENNVYQPQKQSKKESSQSDATFCQNKKKVPPLFSLSIDTPGHKFFVYNYSVFSSIYYKEEFMSCDSKTVSSDTAKSSRKVGEEKNNFSENSHPMRKIIFQEVENAQLHKNDGVNEDYENSNFICETVNRRDFYKHKQGRQVVTTEIIDNNDKVRFIKFDGLTETSARQICEIIGKKMHPMICYNPKQTSYSLWIFCLPIPAKLAKKIAKLIITTTEKAFAVKLSCEITPKYTSRKSALANGSNENKMPLHNGEVALQEGEFTNDMDTIKVALHDLSKFEEFFEKQDEAIISKKAQASEILKALEEQEFTEQYSI